MVFESDEECRTELLLAGTHWDLSYRGLTHQDIVWLAGALADPEARETL